QLGCYGNMAGSPSAVSERTPRDSPVRPDRGAMDHFSPSHTYTDVGPSSSGLGDVSMGYFPDSEGPIYYDRPTEAALAARKALLAFAGDLPCCPPFVKDIVKTMTAGGPIRNSDSLQMMQVIAFVTEQLSKKRKDGTPVVEPGLVDSLQTLMASVSRDFVTRRQGRVAAPGTESINTYCTGCLEDVTEDDEVKTLPCGHNFHSKCIDPWLSVSGTCQLCMREV
ncbi:hypothetical protein SeMB42_g07754, partial [Synchytrium endobioticum]